MKEVRYFYVPDAKNNNELPQEEATHALRVLRLKSGDEMFIMDGTGNFYHAEVSLATNKKCLYEIKETLPQHKTWKGHIHLAIAPTKNMDRIEWMTEKVTEIGFDELSFLNCAFSERKVLRTERIEKIVVSAVKQSRKPWKPIVNEMIPFKDFISMPREGRKFIAHCYQEIEKHDLFDIINKEKENVTILVGPEGDFSIEEVRLAIENGYESISLGQSRLRTETAGLMAVTMSQLSLRL
ncbi:MAG: 16S rRNA (uracil(1498)-N(3))-methyltransferase [Prevotella sp.]|jgi:16S rRNA (uracil1498-N3)-methyltransferase|nr:16S rRNA (uracil(1498)-N(3))-methyltransferase [Prevotella sp.]MBP6527537.1 16S rRNA (uracil(1498)-N(3))-methyltransferase [Prevotella sp.]MBP7098361.1 16S rRNA (uracil(1498)-N(3))-methyltransferase [Prevotella sp.]MBP8687652.1 16S rRNA (uracil(1498)-N(3))-methyltransferase [Prevotella sp.]MBP8935722.1 16S rRNA (uracil(1498)-N(3))-methyltransferase [Prevotella sp.]MBP9982744.1 16S rRNA (uracil(1498)-N(3))-methyltransferase [Prevotella sp.]